ncbi:MAG: hypothetical protein J6Q14_01555 [Oscillospiraceae bacterium]|nr:hypothetical protein [Oscillospiraceae bacterium]
MSIMKVGYARKEITPQESVPLAGYGNTSQRLSETILDPLYATCIAFVNDAGERALLYTIDLIHAGHTTESQVRPAISEATGIPVSHIHVSATHTHAAPDTTNTTVPTVDAYLELFKTQMVAAGVEALADVKDAQLFMTGTDTYHLNFVRHYLTVDGTYAGSNFGDLTKELVGHESEPDTRMQLAKIVREGGKDIIICNYGVHQTHTGGQLKHEVSADIVGVIRSEMEQETGCLFAYFTGACGNVVPSSKIEGENVVPAGNHKEHGKALAQVALSALKELAPASFGAIRARTATHVANINHTTDHLEAQAKEVYDLYIQTNDRPAANKLARQKYGFSSVYHAGAILNRMKKPATKELILDTLAVGDLAFVLAPYEMFAGNGIYIREKSPFPMTMVLTLANRPPYGYLPTRKGFEYGSYEGDTCWFEPGIGEDLADRYVEMLHDMK